uniref:Cyclophilin TM1367-like domain-containing protein n=1 Tax=candidate division WOR-3 bacterium TaxID=2052148 RepID=A0A7C4CDE3_UNCW3
MRNIRLNVGGLALRGTLDDSALAEQVWALLPYEADGESWGREVYFPVQLKTANTAPVVTVNVGDIAYWPDGPDLCLFFGPTPKSIDSRPVTLSPVTVIGSFACNPDDFVRIEYRRRGIPVRVERDNAGPA